MKTSKNILDFITTNKQATGQELAEHLGITDRAVRKQLFSLLKNNSLIKKGHPPVVYYQINDKQTPIIENLPIKIFQIIEKNYLFITPSGKKLNGVNGFFAWCQKQNLSFKKTANEYVDMVKKFSKYKKNGLIDGMSKIKSTYKNVFLDNLYYLDFYSIDRFGKTKLGQLLLYAKQSQQESLITDLIDDIAPDIKKLIEEKNITSVGFIPPTVKRQVQFMTVLQKKLKLKTRIINIKKIKADVAVPQKSLSKLSDRIENASHSIVVSDNSQHGNILLIDDAVGSGSTLNETARQIREKGICDDKIIGLAITGSFKGFDVISEV
jgi:hypoxanthine-guanine phosphoribosyltransferase